ncbi:Protease synthase and sporulation protein PAI 2 [Paenibacillus allorhizoplanae]|uniref:Protease synthase and sporulation protein PAI 2 n=1 Tax=Paenibacillus allorhizoplanae TaxID=2905648 RepID=A0ABM9CZH2_9BACL|nr:FMN-binding negative transcriptional regulator [Paenibacillus allorhizoplanae]CAH1228277.1 Protease synthase and sporulation protein PAI 2 [Paenibacillus allorhizoplanae]
MCTPSHFKIEVLSEMYDLINAHSFATVVSHHQERPFATHIPLMLRSEEQCLYGHFARSNPQWMDIEGQEILVIFQGPHCYISPSWYGTPAAVPTWNYTAVHVYGKIELIHDDQEVLRVLRQLTSKYEGADSRYDLDSIDPHFIAGLSNGIQAFRLSISSIEGKAKLSQNQPVERQERIIRELELKGDQEQQIAALMKRSLRGS